MQTVTGEKFLRVYRAMFSAAFAAGLGIVPSAVPARADFAAPISLSAAAQNAHLPQAGIDRDGNAVVVWTSEQQHVQTRTLSAGGALSPIQTLSEVEPPWVPLTAQVATSPNGHTVFVWWQLNLSDGRSRLEARTRSSAGVLGPIRIVTGTREVRDYRVAIEANGDAVIIWAPHRPDPVKARTFSASGVVGPSKNLSKIPDPDFLVLPRVAVDVDGDAVFAWHRTGDPGRIEARTLSAAGVLGPLLTLSRGSNPQVSIDADGDAVFTWEQPTGTIGVRTLSKSGVLGLVETLSRGTNPQVSVDDDGDAVFTWEYFDGAKKRVRARARSAAGVFGPIQTLSAPGQNAYEPQVAVDANGDAVFLWRRFDGADHRVQARIRSATGVLGSVQTLSAAGQNTGDPKDVSISTLATVAVSRVGDAVATWVIFDETTGSGRVQLALGP